MPLADKSMYTPSNDTQNYPFCILKLVVEMYGHLTYNRNSIKVLKVVEPTSKKTLL